MTSPQKMDDVLNDRLFISSIIVHERRVTRLEALMDFLTKTIFFDKGDDLVEIQRSLSIAIDKRREKAQQVADLRIQQMMRTIEGEE